MPQMKVKVVKKGNDLEKLLKQIKDLDDEFVEVGHFLEQGQHPTAKMSYPSLMRLHHTGAHLKSGAEIPPRPVLSILDFRLKGSSSFIKDAVLSWSKKKATRESGTALLNMVGEAVASMEKDIFGDTGSLEKNSDNTTKRVGVAGPDAPLIDTGSLQGKVAYKTSRDNTIKEGSK